MTPNPQTLKPFESEDNPFQGFRVLAFLDWLHSSAPDSCAHGCAHLQVMLATSHQQILTLLTENDALRDALEVIPMRSYPG